MLENGREVPLIPRYFDLLVLLIERRNEAVHRREILGAVWSDVVVSDGALSQAVRSLRRVLHDNPREPVFVRTIPRHGYRFVFPQVVEEPDETPIAGLPRDSAADPEALASRDPATVDAAVLDVDLDTLCDSSVDEGDRREAAERLHTLGTSRALARLGRRAGHAAARAMLRDTRWEVAEAGPVAVIGQPAAWTVLRILLALRFTRVVRLVGGRWAGGVAGGALAGCVAGILGGLVLRFGPGSEAGNSVLVALPLVGLIIGGAGAAGVGAGLAAAEALIRSYRGVALVVSAAAGGALVAGTAHLVGLWAFEGLFGRRLEPVAGAFEGLVIGAAIGLGYALSTPRQGGGMASPHGAARLRVALVTGLICAAAGCGLAWSGRYLGAMSLDFMARSFPGSQVGLAPLARLLGEAEPGGVTRLAISAWEGFMFGAGMVLGLTRRPS